MRWQSIEGKSVDLVPWVGTRVAFLTQRADLDAAVMARILGALDRAWEWYRDVTGRDPAPRFQHEGRTTIAEVDGIGGAAWALLGETGIEIRPEYFSILYEGVSRNDEFDQPLFYELGRNFWFYRSLDHDKGGSVCTGYAVFMRFHAMAAAGVKGARYNGVFFPTFRQAIESLLDIVAKFPPDMRALLAKDHQHVAHVEGVSLSTADLMASYFFRWLKDDDAIRRFLAAASKLPAARNVDDVIRNLQTCAHAAGAEFVV